MNRFDLILFDLDGTLIETAPEIADAVNDTLEAFNRPHVSQQQVNDWIGHGTRELLISALAFADKTTTDLVRSSASFARIEAAFVGHYQKRCGSRSHLYPQVRETLHALRADGVKLAVVTNKERRYTKAVLDAHKLTPLFDRIISGDTFPLKKPDPMGVHDCLHHFRIRGERTLFVGDSSIDIATARNAGVEVWALPYGYNMGQPIQSANPDRVIADVSALLS
jgi:phosphoglycolate phosphatase